MPKAQPAGAFHRRIAAEALLLGGGGGVGRLAPALAQAAVDLNPHQVEAAAFALDALPTGGAILADEVGLGKTIEAGLVMAQLACQGRGRILVLVPATLRAQWQEELAEKLGLASTIVDRPGRSGTNPFDTGGIAIASQPFAANHAGDVARVPWDLAVIDEAHRLRNAYRSGHKTGRALRKALSRCPKLLLTATPLQNEAAELLGLASFIDGSLLGEEDAFRLQYGGELTGEKLADLKARLAPVVVRTLRRQVKEYLKFTSRRSMVEDFAPTPQEQELYDRVSDYLRREDAAAIPHSRRALLVLVYRKILASSSFALAATLERLANGLAAEGSELEAFAEEVEELDVSGEDRGQPLLDEVAELRACASLARSIKVNAKGEALCRALDRAFTVARSCGWPQKAVVFTEFRRTQDYLRDLLGERGHRVVCLSGDSGGAAARQALVESFRREDGILLMTEAGAEGLNLQFCNLLVNYDLPWNPQRIEQRIGRCHRYGQTRDVLVVNFLNRKNAADARLYELLAGKLALFDGVFGASDEVLGALGTGLDFERRVLDVYQSCRGPEEIDRAFEVLRADLDARIGARLAAARSLLFERFDGEVRGRLRLAAKEAKEAVERRIEAETLFVKDERERVGERERKSELGVERERAAGGERVGGPDRARLARAAAARIREEPLPPVSMLEITSRDLPAELHRLAGREGWWLVYRLELTSLLSAEHLVHVVLYRDGDRFEALTEAEAARFAALPTREETAPAPGGGPPANRSLGGALALDGAQDVAFDRIRGRLHADLAARVASAADAARERQHRVVEDGLLVLRQGADAARETWATARRRLASAGEGERAAIRAEVEKAEREHRQRLKLLHTEEGRLYAQKDGALETLGRSTEIREQRRHIATAYWRCR
jgi:superfamily II DNA or RNA helicase